MSDFSVDGVVILPARNLGPEYSGPAEQCGQNKWCVNSPNPNLETCGTWLGQSDYCCWAIVTNTTNSIHQPCQSIPELEGATFETIGKAAKNATSECPKNNFQLTEYDDGTLACCPRESKSTLTYYLPTDGFYDYLLGGYRCGTFTITDIVEVADPTVQDGSGGGGSGGGSGGSPTSQPASSGTSSPRTSENAQATPNAAPSKKSLKIASLMFGSMMFAIFIGAQL